MAARARFESTTLRSNGVVSTNAPPCPTIFLVSSYFASHPITVLLKILGGRMYGPSPTSHLGVDRPPVPLSLRPCSQRSKRHPSFCVPLLKPLPDLSGNHIWVNLLVSLKHAAPANNTA